MDLNAYFLLYDTNPERRREKKKNVRDKSGKYRKIYVVTNTNDEKICLGVSIYVIELFGSF